MALSDAAAAATAAYPLDEASGSAIDAVASLDMTETGGTIDSAAGLMGNARDFELADTELFEVADDAAVSMADIDFTIIAWVKPESVGTTNWIVSKGDGDDLEYGVKIGNSNRFVLWVSSANGFANLTEVSNVAYGAAQTGVWHLVVAEHDSVNNLLKISVNGNAFETAAYSAGSYNSAAPFGIGGYSAFSEYFDGLIQQVVILKNYLLSDDEVDELWNSGAGVPFADWAGAATTRGMPFGTRGTAFNGGRTLVGNIR